MDNQSQPPTPQPSSSQPAAPQQKPEGNKTSSLFLIAGIVILLLILVTVGSMFFLNTQSRNSIQSVVPSPTGMENQVMASPTPDTTKDSSDMQLNKDIEAIDSKIQSLDSDVAEVDKSLNDQQTDLSQ